MSALGRTPTNTNFLLPAGFQIIVKKLPTTTFFTQDISIPGFSLPNVVQANPFLGIPLTGDHIDFEALSMSFKVDEDLRNYLEIYNWICGEGYPDDYEQYKTLAEKTKFSQEGLYSDITILITTNIMNANLQFTFRDAFPVSLSGFRLTTTDNNLTEIMTTATFKYTKYDIITIPK